MSLYPTEVPVLDRFRLTPGVSQSGSGHPTLLPYASGQGDPGNSNSSGWEELGLPTLALGWASQVETARNEDTMTEAVNARL